METRLGHTPAALHAERMARTDGCPEACGNYETPSTVYATADGYIANYICLDCGHPWSTSWKD